MLAPVEIDMTPYRRGPFPGGFKDFRLTKDNIAISKSCCDSGRYPYFFCKRGKLATTGPKNTPFTLVDNLACFPLPGALEGSLHAGYLMERGRDIESKARGGAPPTVDRGARLTTNPVYAELQGWVGRFGSTAFELPTHATGLA
jgi:hypothetical protein